MTNYDSYVNLLLKPNLIPEIDKELATRSLQEFIKQAWTYFSRSRRLCPAGTSMLFASIWRPSHMARSGTW